MPREVSLDAPGTLHRLIISGIEKGKIVDDREDRQIFISLIRKFTSESGTAFYARILTPPFFFLINKLCN